MAAFHIVEMHKFRAACSTAFKVQRFQGALRKLSTSPSDKVSHGSTVDSLEISRLEAQKCTWWDPNGPMKPLHAMNKLRVPLIRDSLIATNSVNYECIGTSTPLRNLNIIDVGCGGGILTEALARLGGNIVGLDASNELLTVAESHACHDPVVKKNTKYVCSTIEEYSKNNTGFFDACIASEVVEHVAHLDIFIKSCVDVIKPGGSLFITTVNKTYSSWLLGIVAAEYILNLLPRGTHNWEKFVSPADVTRLLHTNGCVTNLIHGLAYVFIFNKWYWISDTSINYALHAVKVPI